MGPTRKRDLTVATVLAAVAATCSSLTLYQFFPPITLLSGVSLLVVALAEAGWAFYVRGKINDGDIGDGPGWLHPLAVARSVSIAKASAWVGALVLGWWLGVLVIPVAAPLDFASRGRRYRRRGRGRRMCPRPGRRRTVASALLQVSTGAARQR